MSTGNAQITGLLHAWRGGDAAVLPQLAGLVYEHLRGMAANRLRGSSAPTLSPTVLVHEAFLRLHEGEIDWRDRAHFFALAALHMRNVLVDHARARNAGKRGGDLLQVTLTGSLATPSAEERIDVLHLDAALRRLEAEDARTGKVIELTYFGGMDRADVAHVLQVSVPTVDRALRFGRAWLRRELEQA